MIPIQTQQLPPIKKNSTTLYCFFLNTELDELKHHLSGSHGEELSRQISRARSRVSESVSETGSEKANGSLQRQWSVDSAEKDGLRKRSSSTESKKKELTGEKLIEVEKAETGSVKWEIYKHYLKSIGIFLSVSTIVLNIVFQAFNIASNVWLSVWSEDKNITVNGKTDVDKRDMYLGVYGALGVGQGKSKTVYLLFSIRSA